MLTNAQAFRCHDFDCHRIKPARLVSCRLGINGETFYFDGKAFKMKQFMFGATNGFDGRMGMTTLDVFFKGSRLFSIYMNEYQNNQDYIQFKCKT